MRATKENIDSLNSSRPSCIFSFLKGLTTFFSSVDIAEASLTENWQLVHKLVYQGVDLNSFGSHSYTALHCAVFHNKMSTVIWLIQRGANVNIMSKKGLASNDVEETPLHVAIRCNPYKKKSVIKLLLLIGADTSITESRFGDTPLKLAPSHFKPIFEDYLEKRNAIGEHIKQAEVAFLQKDYFQALSKYITAGTLIYEYFFKTEDDYDGKVFYGEMILSYYRNAKDNYRVLTHQEQKQVASEIEKIIQIEETINEQRDGLLYHQCTSKKSNQLRKRTTLSNANQTETVGEATVKLGQ